MNGYAHELASRLPAGTTLPILPSLLVPCCAHSGTTFLWRCMRYAFHPERVCGRVSRRRGNPRLAYLSSEWTASSCADKKYFLPGLAGNIQGHWDYRKEWFFYGGGAAAFDKGWADYTGIELPLCWCGTATRTHDHGPSPEPEPAPAPEPEPAPCGLAAASQAESN